MLTDLEKSRIMFKLARKNNWNACYDRLEHFKRFQNLKEAVKELSSIKWIVIHKKPKFTGIALNTQYKKEIVDFVEKHMPEVNGYIQ